MLLFHCIKSIILFPHHYDLFFEKDISGASVDQACSGTPPGCLTALGSVKSASPGSSLFCDVAVS